MAIAGKPAARMMRSKGLSAGKESGAQPKTKAAYTKMAKAGRNGNGFKKS